jgi:uncharacterized glyoxalase superfamily protein PhnB
MSSSKLPAGYHTVTPAIVVRDAAAAIDFYQRAFGAEEVNRMAGPDGKIMHAEIRIGDSLVMLGEENEQWGTKSPLLTNGTPGSLHIYVDDADASFDRALKAGATVKYPIGYYRGDRYGKFGIRSAWWGMRLREEDLPTTPRWRAAGEWMRGSVHTSTAAAQASSLSATDCEDLSPQGTQGRQGLLA